MANGQALVYVGGLVLLAGGAYYLHTSGFFTSIFAAMNKALDDAKTEKPPTEDDKKEDTKEEDKEEEDKKSNFALRLVGNSAYISPASFRAYRVEDFI